MFSVPSNKRLLVYEIIYFLLGTTIYIIKIIFNPIGAEPAIWISTAMLGFTEILRRIKTTWELKFGHNNNQILDDSLDSSILRYQEIINKINDLLLLNSWNELSSYFINFSIPQHYVDGSNQIAVFIFNTIWPQKKPDLEFCIKNLENRNSEFIRHYLERAELRGEWWKEDLAWRRSGHSPENYQKLADEQNEWQQKYTKLLFNVCVALNEFATMVRTHSNPDFRLSIGDFAVWDSLGNLEDMHPKLFKPTEYFS